MLFKRKNITEIEKYLNEKTIIVLHWARQVWKTSIMKFLISNLEKKWENVFYHDLEDFRFLDIYNQNIDEILNFWKSIWIKENKKNFVFIDEIQYLKNPSAFLKLTHDHFPFIKLIVSWSSSFEIKSKFKDSLVWRTVNFEIFWLNFEEFLIFKWEKISLENFSNFTISKLKILWQEYAKYWWYPKIVLEDEIEKKEKYLSQIISTYIEKDIKNLANIKDLEKFNKLIKILAWLIWNLLNISEIANTLKIAEKTVNDYIFILEQTYIIKILYPYHKNIRSELTKMWKIYFEDTWIANLLINKNLISPLTWDFFENSIFSELRKKYWTKNLNFWRTNTQKEIDFILEKKWKIYPIEIKLKSKWKKDLKNLKYFLDKYSLKKWYLCSLEDELFEKNNLIDFKFPFEL